MIKLEPIHAFFTFSMMEFIAASAVSHGTLFYVLADLFK